MIAKPDLVIRRGPGARMLKGFLERTGCKITAARKMRINEELADKHYAALRGKSFYPWLIGYISIYDSFAFIMETDRPVAELRDILGSTMVEKAKSDSLRGEYGLANGMNGIHLSESEEVAKAEVGLWVSSGALKEGNIDFDANGYIGRYQNAPDNTRAIHDMLNNTEEKSRALQEERNGAFYNMLKEEAVDVDNETFDKFYAVLIYSLTH